MTSSAAGRTANPPLSDRLLRSLASAGQRATGPRAMVVAAVAERPDAFTAEDIVGELGKRGIGRATVYRTLELMERIGLLSRMHVGSCHGYTVCSEDQHHHHFVCRTCGRIVSVDASEVEAEIRKLADRLRFRVDTHTLEFAGECETCLSVASREQTPI